MILVSRIFNHYDRIFSLKDPLYEAARSPFEWKSIECHTANVEERFHRLFSSFLNILAERKTWKERRIENRGRSKDGWKRDRRDRNDKKGNLGWQKSSHKGDRRRDRESLSLENFLYSLSSSHCTAECFDSNSSMNILLRIFI